jgi:ribonuclease P protein subunit RPR2
MSAEIRRTALKRVRILFMLAQEIVNENPELAERYIKNAKRICMKTRLHLPKEFHMQICKCCKKFLVPGVSSRIRIQQRREPHVVITCLHCDGKTRIPLR